MSAYRRLPRIFLVGSELLNPAQLHKVPTAELFIKLGFFNHPKSGLVHWMPLGASTLNKITALIHRHMQTAGAEEVRMSALSPASLWQQTGRWGGTELFKLTDSSGGDYSLAATCEEDITAVVRSQIASYKNLPLLYYQINTKFRDEKRPRAGLLRGREFIMKDAYSFDTSSEAAMKTYDEMVAAYHRVFKELRVPYVKAEASSGDIGGSMSHEWHYVHKSGEDTLFTCTECGNALNMEKTLSFPVEEPLSTTEPVAAAYFVTADRNTLVCGYYPASRTLLPNLIQEEIPDLDVNSGLSDEEILSIFSHEDALLTKKVVRVMDLRLHSRSNFPDFPIKFVNRSLITTLTDIPIVEAQEGEICGQCNDGTLQASRAIEVGHTFFLGDKYSRPLDCTVDLPKSDGQLETVNVAMGCYGIGVSRLIAAIGEVNRDQFGFRWPACIAPWSVTVINASTDATKTDAVMSALTASSVDARFDDREVLGLGRKTKEARLVGIPLVVIVGRHYPIVEIEVRGTKYGESWKDIYKANPDGWEVEYLESGESDVKHKIHIERLGAVVQALLVDM